MLLSGSNFEKCYLVRQQHQPRSDPSFSEMLEFGFWLWPLPRKEEEVGEGLTGCIWFLSAQAIFPEMWLRDALRDTVEISPSRGGNGLSELGTGRQHGAIARARIPAAQHWSNARARQTP